jgi:hypothetical protein
MKTGHAAAGFSHVPRRSRHIPVAVGSAILLAAVAAFGYLVLRESPGDTSTTNEPPIAGPVDLGPDWFKDVTEGSGISFTYRNGEEAGRVAILETLGGGAALLDYDGDGRLDVFVTGGGYFHGPDGGQLKGHPCKLYRNLGNWRFEDVSAVVGLTAVDWWYTHGASVADYDRDGWPDLLVTGFGRIGLFHNVPDGKGGRRLVDVSASLGLASSSWSTSAAWGDLDGDGWPDLYVCHYCDWSPSNNPPCRYPYDPTKQDVCAPTKFRPVTHSVFRNEAGKAFRDISGELGLTAGGHGLGVIIADLNDDVRPDIYVANDMTFNYLFYNRGGKLEERGMLAGVMGNDRGRAEGSMGVDVGDYDGSGRASIWVTNYVQELHALYRNAGREVFTYDSRVSGVGAIGQSYVGFGTGFIDIDNDGFEDIAIVNGHVLRYPILGSKTKQRPVLFQNVESSGRRCFREVTGRGGPFFQTAAFGRGLAVGDLDNDGWPDLVVSHTNSPVALLRNIVAESTPASWIGVKLIGKENRDVVGSTIVLETPTRKLSRFTKGGGSYLSSGDPRSLFGLGASGSPSSLTVKWSWGISETWNDLKPGAYWELREGEPKARRIDYPR